MKKIWLKQYPDSIPEEITTELPSSLVEMFQNSVKTYSEHPVVSQLGTTLTYKELDERSDVFAAYLQQKLGLNKGDRFAIMLPNVIQYFVALFGAFKAGLVVVNVNPLYTARELAHQLKDAEVNTILVLENFAGTVEQVLPKVPLDHIIVTKFGDEFSFVKRSVINFAVKYIKKLVKPYKLKNKINYLDMFRHASRYSLSCVNLCLEDLAFLQYTGGTTGVPKGAMLTHRNMVSNAEQAYQWMRPFIRLGKETIVTALPLYHIFSLLANCLTFIHAGAQNILVPNPRDMKAFVSELKRQPFTAITGVNTLFNALVNYPDFKTVDFSLLSVTLGGGMAVHKAVADEWKKITGTPICEAYGLTETSPAATINPLTLQEYNGSIGLPISSTEVKIIGDYEQEMGINEIGELCIRGPQVTKGYWKKSEETAQVLDADGWLKTGDVAKVDEKGFVYIVDRKKDMVDVSGFNVYPNEVEEIITLHPGVLEVAVIGVSSDTTGEALKAFIVKKDPDVTADEIRKFARQSLTGYKVPKLYEFRDELPKSPVGKILRRELREEK